ncbi:hypothetical protein KIN20_017988 [Parelaphostrongylus tenuis]|uniref:Uncharacterized protein n=1 Tax=Parelaphostrongylus tenuis TaxID=148309 RepID=A0AAD5MIM2_PARTN|nr:hypothetical protein KIN20_017988 [Parelaphostrongylus tenuis]
MTVERSPYRILLLHEYVLGLDVQAAVEKISRANAQGYGSRIFNERDTCVLYSD